MSTPLLPAPGLPPVRGRTPSSGAPPLPCFPTGRSSVSAARGSRTALPRDAAASRSRPPRCTRPSKEHPPDLCLPEREACVKTAERPRRPPVPASQEPHQGRHEQGTDDRGVEEDGGSGAEPELLGDDDPGCEEGAEGNREEKGG